ncbi:hypothetical protein MBLNU457_g2872t1 [Dothideomycetes sp. NU457]
MTARKRAPSPTPSEGRSMRSFIRKPARFRSPQDPTNRRSSSFMTTDGDGTESSGHLPVKRGPGRPRGSTTKRKRSASTSPSELPPRKYQPAAFPSRSMRETPQERKAFDDETRAAMSAKFAKQDDGFGEDWADIEPGPALEALHPDRHIVPVFENKAKRACLANKSFEDFYRTQMVEIHNGTVPETISRAMVHTALEMCWRDLAVKIFGQKVKELEDVVARIVKEVVKPPEDSPRDSHSPWEAVDIKAKSEDTIAVRRHAPALAVQPKPALPSAPSTASSQESYGTVDGLDFDPDNQTVPVVEQYRDDWRRQANRPLDVRMVNGTMYGNQGWDIDRYRRRPFAAKDWRIHPQFNRNEQMLDISDSE